VRTYILVAVLTLSSLVARVAEARHVRFAGPHPIAAKYGGGYCYIQAPHMHIYGPDRPNLYQNDQGEYTFTGDPTPFGYEGDKYPYYGNHPLVSVTGGEPVYCYINGPHFHAEPPPTDGYRMKNGVAFYVGPFAPGYATMRQQRVRMVNAEYRPYAQYRPTVQVEPPPEWQGEVYVAPPSLEVSAPGVQINAPAPPGVVVSAPAPRVVVAPPPPPGIVVTAPAPRVYVPPPPRVVIAPPPPPGIVVTAPAPHVVIGAPAPRIYVAPAPGPVYVTPGKVHHDNGKHKGWYK
jgi:hypothetical protein